REYTKYTYDKIDRLVGAEHSRGSNGLSIAYTYDGNGNILRQIYLQRDQNNNGIPDCWEFIHGLSVTNDAPADGSSTDSDGDGWTDFQEWRAGSNPNDAASVPDFSGVAGVTGTVFQAGFAVSNFVMAVGQLDGVGAEEIVIGADGKPDGVTNRIAVLTREGFGWRTEEVEIGPYGVTSATSAQPTNTSQAAIYLGLRNFDSTGVVMRVAKEGGVWTNSMIAFNAPAPSNVNSGYVQDSRKVPNLLLARLNQARQSEQSLYRLEAKTNGWTAALIHTSAPARGGEAVPLFTVPTGGGMSQFRLVRIENDGDGDVVNAALVLPAMPTGAIYNSEYGAWYVLSPASSWNTAQAYSRTLGGHLVTIENAVKSQWLYDTFGGINGTCWIGLYKPVLGTPNNLNWFWDSGYPYVYADWMWASGEPNNLQGKENRGQFWNSVRWNDAAEATSCPGIVEVRVDNISMHLTNFVADAVAVVGDTCASDLRGVSNAVSAVVAYWDADGRFNLHEHLVTTNAAVRLTTNAVDCGSACLPMLGMAACDYLGTRREVLFTGEPDGRVFAWTATSNAPLKRSLFNGQYAGKGWSQLSGYRDTEASEWLLGLSVDPADASSCSLIAWTPQPALWTPPVFAQTAPRVTVLPSPTSCVERATVRVRINDSEGNPTVPELEFQKPGESTWQAATLSAADGILLAGSVPGLTSSPTGLVHELVWECRTDLGDRFVSNVWLRVRGRDVTLTGDWSKPSAYHVTVLPWYTVNVSAGAKGSVEPSGAVRLMEGTSTTLVARAATGYHVSKAIFDGVETNCTGLGTAEATLDVVNVTSDHEIHFEFAVNLPTLTVVSAHGTPQPEPGAHTFEQGSRVTNRVDAVVDDKGTRYRCVGWRLEGGDPASGVTNECVTVIERNCVLTWLWETNYCLSAASQGPGVLRGGSEWYAAGATAHLTAEAEAHATFRRFEGDLEGATIVGNTVSLVMNGPRSVTAVFEPDMYTLLVLSEHGGCVPEAGTHAYAWGTSVACAVTNASVSAGDGLIRYDCIGWIGSGDVTNGVGTNCCFTLKTDSSLAWQWQTNYWLAVTAQGHGSVAWTNDWTVAGTNVVLTASPEANYHLAGWTGSTNGCVIEGNQITVPMTEPRNLTAVFVG
ncbi:MAG: hypothetical protein GX542_03535, partial [Rhodococcus sp.]|nr:hypothetical protein [Rhodococcus sp. (in: high G+C Gram-positive bacteria)]